MQIPDQFLSPVVVSSIPAQPPQNSRAPARPVIIEGQLIEDKKEQAKKPTPSFTLPSFQQDALQPEAPKPENQQDASENTLSTQIGTAPEVLYSAKSLSENAQPDSSNVDNSFPYGNRRSQEGLAGSSLVVQRYLNNEPANTIGIQQQGNLDLYI